MSKDINKLIDSESDPRILRELLKLVHADNDRLRGVIKEIQDTKDRVSQQSFTFEESLKILRHKFFGKSSEKSPQDRRRDRLNDDPELLVHSENLLPPPVKKAVKSLPEEEVIHEASADDLITMSQSLEILNPSVEQWEEVEGLFDQSVEIDIVERSFKKIIHKRKKYRLKKEFSLSEKEIIISAPGPVKLVPGSSYSIDFTTAVIVDKYLNHLPLERQCRTMESLGLKRMHSQVLYNLSRLASEHLLPIAEKLKEQILSSEVVHSDETPWPVTNNKDSDGYMWILANNRGSFYRFEPTRSGKVVQETLKGFKGTVMTDGYSGYSQFKDHIDINLALCHAHARRYFFEIKEDYPEVEFILNQYQELFLIEKLARDFAELKTLREQRSRPIIKAIHMWLQEKLLQSRAQSAFRKAIEYSLKNWKELNKFLDDPYIPLTNNEAERTIRQAVMGRKNFHGSRSIDGADVSAIMYTIIESCKKVELEPRDYLQITLKNAAAGKPTETPFEMASRLRQ